MEAASANSVAEMEIYIMNNLNNPYINPLEIRVVELRNYGADNVIDNKRKLLRDVLLASLPQAESASFALGYFLSLVLM